MNARPLPNIVSSEIIGTPTVIVASYRRSGTHLTIDSLLNNSIGIHDSYLNLDRLDASHPEALSATEFEGLLAKASGKTTVLKTHAPQRSVIDTPDEAALFDRLMAKSGIVYVLRDPRDVMVSLWHFRLSFDPAYAKQTTFSDHVRRNIEHWRKHVEYWLERGVPTVRFEDWVDDYERTLDEMLATLDLARRQDAINVYGVTAAPRRRLSSGPAMPKRLLDAVAHLSNPLSKLLVRMPKLTGVSRRSGRVGDWRSMFSEDDRALVEDVHGDFLQRLGYEPA